MLTNDKGRTCIMRAIHMVRCSDVSAALSLFNNTGCLRDWCSHTWRPDLTYCLHPPSCRRCFIHLQRVTPSKNRSFFSTGASDSSSQHSTPRTPADVSRIREQAGTTPRALDRDFLASSPAAISAVVDFGIGAAAAAAAKQPSTATKSKMFNRRTWTKEENDQLQEGLASLGGPGANLGKIVRELCKTF